jgi:HlyD family secretion protein
MDRAKRNLDYTTITSPVKGVIIDRRVNIGQTVVSSLSAPSLFLIAKDLTRMQVWVAVNEADIGSIRPGQPVSFTADAYPGQMFAGQVNKVRLNASMTQNVVTYTVEVTTDNSSGKLLPYLTANVKFEVSRHNDVLLVPNAALRFTTRSNQIAQSQSGGSNAEPNPATSPSQTGERRRWRDGGSRGGATTAPSNANEGMTRGVVWIPDGKLVRPISVFAGASDGIVTEVRGPGVTEGMQVVTGEQQPRAGGGAGGSASGSGSGESTNPFMPQMPGRGRGGGGGGGGRGR